MDERAPDHSTISQNRRRRFQGEGIFCRLFERIVRQCMEKGLVEGRILLTDSTAERETTGYMERLDFYEEQERVRLEASGAIKAQRKGRAEKKKAKVERTLSATEPDAGMMRRPGKPEGMHYQSRQSLDAAHGIVADVAVTPGGVSYKVEFRREDFRYEQKKDGFICPAGKELPLRSLEREDYNICRTYRSDRKDCRCCPLHSRCVSDSHQSRTVRVNIFEEWVKRVRERDGTPPIGAY